VGMLGAGSAKPGVTGTGDHGRHAVQSLPSRSKVIAAILTKPRAPNPAASSKLRRKSQRGPHLGSSPDAIPSCKVIGPITRAFLEVLEALLWGFHNARSGCCFPSYETIAARAECARSTVAEALKALESAGVLT
jgi:hypothetical protein